MKIGGIISIILGAINIIIGFAGLSSKYADQATSKLGFGIGLLVLGLFLINRAKKRKEEQDEKNKWKNE